MATKKAMLVFLGILVASVALGSANKVDAETMNYKFYTWSNKAETFPVGDVEGHVVRHENRGAFYVLENGEIATVKIIATGDLVKSAGPFWQYVTINFADGSTIIIRSEGTLGGGAGGWKSQIVKGTGRFEGIKGTHSAKVKYLPLEQGEAGPKGYGEGTITYTLPSK